MSELLLRLDTEDFLTPESDDALLAVLAALEAAGVRATFPLVAEKLRALRRRGRGDVLQALRRHDVGYHSDSHSVHPTLAEALEPLGWQDGVRHFLERETPGAEEVGERFGGLACYTQPGANWVPHAGPALRRWGCPFHYSEDWNAYVDFDGRPFRYGGVLHWSAPVAAPKPFLSALPAVLDEALATARRAASGPSPVNVVCHPTELCTSAFWDAVNWGAGAQPPPDRWRPAPLRPPAEVEAATAALRRYLSGLRQAGVEFVGAAEFARRYPDRALGLTLPAATILAWPAGRCLRAPGLAVSAAESFAAAVVAHLEPDAQRLPIAHVDGPSGEPPAHPAYGPVPAETLRQAARWAVGFVRRTGRVPDRVPLPGGAAEPASFQAALATRRLRPAPLEAARWVRPPERLHWDWPIFAPGFAAPRLRAAALRQAWTFKPAVPATEASDRRGPWRAGAGAQAV